MKAPEQQLRAIAKELREHEAVEAAYAKPPAQPPLNEMAPAAVDAPPATPNFTSRQIYLDAAPGGIDARHAWMLRGGRGEGVRIIDIEGRGASATKILRKTRVAWLVARQARILAGETTGRPSSENSVATLTASA